MSRRPHIIAMGGNANGPDATPFGLERYVMAQTGKTQPRVCLVATASGDDPEYVRGFHSVFRHLGAEAAHLPLFARTPIDLRDFVLSQDVIFVGGGNTKSLLAVWRDWGLDEVLREAWHEGVILCGVSAGANCWFESCITDSWDRELRVISCLGFLRGSFCPHYDGEADRRPTYMRFVADGAIAPGYAAEDGCAAHFVGTELAEVVVVRPAARGYFLERRGSEAIEQELPRRFLET